MNRSELKAFAKEQLAGNHFTMIFLMIVFVAVFGICGMIPLIGAVVAILIASPISLGYLNANIKLIKGEEINIGDLFGQMHLFGKSIWLNIQISVFTTLWSLLFFIPGIIKSLSYSAAKYILIANPELSAGEALEKSMKLMDGHKMELFFLQLSFILWEILIAITFGVAGFYVIPYMNATMANFYIKIGAINKV